MNPRTPDEIQQFLEMDLEGRTTEELRDGIDALDNVIIAALVAREKLSLEIQHQRVAAGGTRINLGREQQVYTHYNRSLPHAGPEVAGAVLQYCRGRAG